MPSGLILSEGKNPYLLLVGESGQRRRRTEKYERTEGIRDEDSPSTSANGLLGESMSQ